MQLSEKTLNDFENILPSVLYEYFQAKDGKTEIKYVSPNSKEIIGYPAQRFIGKGLASFLEIVHPDDQERLEKEDTDSIDDDFFSTEARIELPSGEIRWIRFRSKPSARLDSGEVTWVGCIVDITDHKRLEFEKDIHLRDLQKAVDEIKTLKGILPICTYCKKIRDDKGYWNLLEAYMAKHTLADFSHSICPDCAQEYFPEDDLY